MVTKLQKQLKTQIREQQEKLLDEIKASTIDDKLPEEEKEVLRKNFQTTFATFRGTLADLKAQLVESKMNPNGSSHYSFTPSGVKMNRTQARRFRKLRREGRIKPTVKQK